MVLGLGLEGYRWILALHGGLKAFWRGRTCLGAV